MTMKLIPTDAPYKFDHANESETTVQGVRYLVWADFMMRGMFAQNTETGEVKKIKGSGYISNDLTARKAIAAAFGLDSFRK